MNLYKSIWHYKCPRCRKGDLFIAPFDIKKPLNMNERCAYCNQSFEPEPGYYFGAMFISYIWTAWTALAIVGFCMLVLDWGIDASFTLLLIVSVLSYFFIMRVSRSMYIHLDVRYDKNIAEKVKNS